MDMVEDKELLILKVSESKKSKQKQLRVTIPIENSEDIKGRDYVQLIKVKSQNEE